MPTQAGEGFALELIDPIDFIRYFDPFANEEESLGSWRMEEEATGPPQIKPFYARLQAPNILASFCTVVGECSSIPYYWLAGSQ